MHGIKYFIKGGGEIILTDQNFLHKGGEGRVYAIGGMAYKIFFQKKYAMPECKITELAALDRDTIIRPLDIVTDAKNEIAGFSMRLVKNAIYLSRLLSNGFRRQRMFTEKNAFAIIEAIKETTQFVHDQGCLVVDGNEMNYLVDERTLKSVYFIDVSNYQTRNYLGMFVNPEIRDWHSNEFTRMTDWFSFGIVACKMFLGIHPYRGRHSAFKQNDLIGRMKANVSIFNKDVSLGANVRDLSCVPDGYEEWFMRIFEKGERIAPPQAVGSITIRKTVQKAVSATDYFDISKIMEYDEEIAWARKDRGRLIACTKTGQIFIGCKMIADGVQNSTIVLTDRKLRPVRVAIDNERLQLMVLDDQKALDFPFMAEEMFVLGDSLFVKQNGKIVKVTLGDIGDRVFGLAKNHWSVMRYASQIFDGFVLQDMFGRKSVMMPTESGNGMEFKLIDEINDYKIIDGKYDRGFLVMAGYRGSAYGKIIIRFDEAFNYECIIEEGGDLPNINFTALDKGMMVMINDDGSIEIIGRRIGSQRKKILDKSIRPSMALFGEGNEVLFHEGDAVYSMRCK